MKTLSWLISGLLLFGPALQTVSAHQQDNKQTSNIEKIKIKIAKLGVGEKARATITTKDDSKIKDYVYSAGGEAFIMRDRKTNSPTTIRSTDVTNVEAVAATRSRGMC